MRALRVPLDALAIGRRELPEEQARYVARVHRSAIGDALLLFDGKAGTEADATVVALDDGRAHVEISVVRAAAISGARPVTLLQCLGKGDKMDAIVRDATELGAGVIVPVTSERTIVKLGDREASRVARWRKIAEEAARQSGRGIVPDVREPRSIDEIAREIVADVRLALAPEGAVHAPETLRTLGPRSLAFLVGPEGGLSSAELSRLAAAGWSIATLGPVVLRTETVATAVLGGLLLLDQSPKLGSTE